MIVMPTCRNLSRLTLPRELSIIVERGICFFRIYKGIEGGEVYGRRQSIRLG